MRPHPSTPPLGHVCSKLLAAWNEARGEDLLPIRKDLRPAAIASILTRTYILDYRSADAVIYTLVGSDISEELGYELTGRNLIELIAEEERPFRRARWKLMAETPCGLYGLARVPTQRGVAVPFANICLPMRANGGGKLHFIGAVEEAPGLRPLIELDPARQSFQQNVELAAIDIGSGAPQLPGLPESK